jgi:hypothetical protein
MITRSTTNLPPLTALLSPLPPLIVLLIAHIAERFERESRQVSPVFEMDFDSTGCTTLLRETTFLGGQL